jgi:hypothetical protein
MVYIHMMEIWMSLSEHKKLSTKKGICHRHSFYLSFYEKIRNGHDLISNQDTTPTKACRDVELPDLDISFFPFHFAFSFPFPPKVSVPEA